MMGAGKTTTAKALAKELGLPHHDSDVQILRQYGRTGGEIAATDGIDALHRLEVAALLDALADEAPSVISAAAYTIEEVVCRQALANGAFTVVLEAPIGSLADRSLTSDHRRPIDQEQLKRLFEKRQPLFAQGANLQLDALRPTSELVAAIIGARSIDNHDR